MFLRCTTRKKNGKPHRYWSVVENKRCAGDRVVQRHVLYLGEINERQEIAWQSAAAAFPEAEPPARTAALFPAERAFESEADIPVVRVNCVQMALRKPRQYGACWLACHLYQELGLDRFWSERLTPSRKGTRWDLILQTLVAYRHIASGSESSGRARREMERPPGRPEWRSDGRSRVNGGCTASGSSVARWATCSVVTSRR